MFLKVILKQIIFITLLLNRLSTCQPLTSEEEEDNLNNYLKHFIKRIELVGQKTNSKFSNELQNLIEKFHYSLAKASFKEKSLLLEQYTENLEFADFLNAQLDKQYVNEDILMESWYLNEIAPYVCKDLYNEVMEIIHDLKEAYRTEDLEEKFNIYTDIGESISEKLLDYFYGEDQQVPVLNAQLKYYAEYLQYLLNELTERSGEFEMNIRELLAKVENAKAIENKSEKEDIIDLFDDLSTKFGRYLDEHSGDFKMFKFGE